MTQYAALIYSRDVDWSRPEFAEETKQYAEFGEEAAQLIRGGAALYQTSTATTVRVEGGRGGDVVTTDGPYAETKEGLTGFYLLEFDETTKQYDEFGEEAAAVIRGGASLYQSSTATTVRVEGGRGGEVVTTDGPYAETKEALTGFYLLECADLDEAIATAAKIPAAWDGAVEVRPVIDFGG